MRLLRLSEVMQVTGLSRSGIYKCIAEGQFPLSVAIGVRSKAWVESEVQDWVKRRVEERDCNRLYGY